MYKQTTTIIKDYDVENIIVEEEVITSEETLQRLTNFHKLVKHPTKGDRIIEYQRFGLMGCTIVRRYNMCETIVIMIKEI